MISLFYGILSRLSFAIFLSSNKNCLLDRPKAISVHLHTRKLYTIETLCRPGILLAIIWGLCLKQMQYFPTLLPFPLKSYLASTFESFQNRSMKKYTFLFEFWGQLFLWHKYCQVWDRSEQNHHYAEFIVHLVFTLPFGMQSLCLSLDFYSQSYQKITKAIRPCVPFVSLQSNLWT